MSKPRRVLCVRCGRKYDLGAPHQAFCRGRVPRNSKCSQCGAKEYLREHPRRPGVIVCDACLECESE
jgi:hypothetical protein